MRVLLVYAHPEPTSFTAALKNVASETLKKVGHSVEISDLYGEAFNPVAGRHDFLVARDESRFHYQTEQQFAFEMAAFAPDIAREQARCERADLIVWLFPIWWGGVPAILKGWFERVLAYGFAYSDGRRYETGYFKQKAGLLCISTGGTESRFSANGVYGTMEQVLWPTQRLIVEYLGMNALPPFVAYGAPRVDEARREEYLQRWRARLLGIQQEAASVRASN
jgi:NAD(P)H dehydrogenase (quinone)